MKKNLYYRTVFKRSNKLKEGVLAFFLAFCSWPRLLLEVFIRKNFGERYFSFAASLTIGGILALLPLIYLEFISRIYRSSEGTTFIVLFTTWYGYLAAFLYMCFKRHEEIKHLPSVFDFGRFSLSTGEIHPWFLDLRFSGEPATIRTIEIWLEPLPFAIGGFLLWAFGQPIGLIILVSSIFYSLSYAGAYHQGDHFIMDQIDEMICNEEIVNAFVEGRESSETRGVSFYGRRPADPETRRRLAETFVEENTVEAL